MYLRGARRIGRLRLPSRLWFDLDVIPFIVRTTGAAIDERACSAVRKALMYLNLSVVSNVPRVAVGYRHQVLQSLRYLEVILTNQVEVDANFRIHLCDFEHYEQTTSQPTWQSIQKLAAEFRDKQINFAFFSSTPQGGGGSNSFSNFS